MNCRLIEIASWRIVSELCRRYAGKFKILETHPCDGTYDCLSIYDQSDIEIAALNRNGRFHVFQKLDGAEFSQEPYKILEALIIGTDNPKDILDRISTMMGLPVPSNLPKSTPETLTYIFIAAFLTHTAFGTKRWECRNGYYFVCNCNHDYGCFHKFPRAKDSIQGNLREVNMLRNPGARFWFMLSDGDPVLCLETTGTVWNLKGEQLDLMSLYKKDRKIWPLISKIAGHLIP